MAGATGSWEPGQTWYGGLFDKVTDTAGDLFSFGIDNLNKAFDLLPGQAFGPVGAVVKGAREVNTTSKTIFGNTAPGIQLPGNLFDNLFTVPDVYGDDEPTVLAETVVTAKRIGNMFTDTEPAAGSTGLPFWVKATIVASVIIGTVLIVKGSMERA